MSVDLKLLMQSWESVDLEADYNAQLLGLWDCFIFALTLLVDGIHYDGVGVSTVNVLIRLLVVKIS